MAITTQDFVTITRNAVAAVQGASKILVDLTVGSVLRAVLEANTAVVLWLQGLILQLLATTRASTSTASDLDSFMLDFGVSRLVAIAASGQVTFSRFSTTNQAIIPIGATVQTSDGSQQYLVVTDTTNANYSVLLGGYVLLSGVTGITVLVQSIVAGAAGNSNATAINTLTQGISGVDTVSNAANFTNGADYESDSALRIRFIAYIAGLSKATKNAVGYAITSLQQGLTYTLTENFTYAGTAQNGYFYLVVNDGTGAPTGTLLTTVANAIEAVRPVTSTFGIFAPTILTANIALTITVSTGYDKPTLIALVAAALRSYIASLPLGGTLTYTRITQIAYDASAGVSNVTLVLLNSATVDIVATNKQVILAGTVTVS